MNIKVADKIVIGVDPGTVIMGYGIIHISGEKLKLLNFGVLKLNKLENQPDRLKKYLNVLIE